MFVAGQLCEVNINECESSPCQNGGTCIDRVNGFHCDCPYGYLDYICSSLINECESNPCQHGGHCIDGVTR